MYLRDLQTTLRRHDAATYRVARDNVWEPIQLRLLKRLPKRFIFGGVKKVVIQVGPPSDSDLRHPDAPGSQQFSLIDSIVFWHHKDFDITHFLNSSRNEQIATTVAIIATSFRALEQRFSSVAAWLFEELSRISAESNKAANEDAR